MPDRKPDRDNRPWVVGGIGCLGIVLLSLCIPIVYALTHLWDGLGALLLPLAVIVATGLAILVVWRTPARRNVDTELDTLRTQVAALNERLTNLEIMDNYSRRFTERHTAAEAPVEKIPTRARETE